MGFELTADETVAELTDKGSFNVFDFVSGTVTPEDTITVYTNANAALKLAKILVAEKARDTARGKEDANDFSIGDEYEGTDEEELSNLHTQLVASGLVFEMKGLTPEAIRALDADVKDKAGFEDGKANDEYAELFNNTLIGRSIVSVTNPAGQVNTDKWTAKMVKGFLPSLYTSEANKLYEAAAELSYVGAIFDRAVNADF